jgi:hypothetical protein
MVDSSVTFQMVSIPEAAVILRLSESSVRRLVKAGQLEAERIQRPQGHVWLVKVPAPSSDQVDQPPDQIAASGDAPASTLSSQPAADAIAAMIQATLTPIIGPLVAELGSSRQLVERQADTIREQAEQIGTLRAERDAAQASILATQTATPSSEPAPAVWRRWWLAAFVLVSFAAVILLVWPR